MSKKKALRRVAATAPELALARSLTGTIRKRYREARSRDGDDAGLTSLEYALLAAAILVVVVLLAAAVTALLNKKIDIIKGIT
ncbi:hypothetical protein [Embleya sp. MST-111070]|uniref:hypothetical protein n=1 Tax=Embleya sp. MST-111070 TaxID=3398231 RepID=UPI003F73947E